MSLVVTFAWYDHIISIFIAGFGFVLIYEYGWLYGIGFNVLMGLFQNVILSKVLNAKSCTVEEENYHIRNGMNPKLMIATIEKVSVEEFRNDNIRRILREIKLKSKVIKILGRRYWKPF